VDFAFSVAQDRLRADVRMFIDENLTAELKAELDTSETFRRRGPATRRFFEKLAERGWVAVSWPREWGGQDGSRTDQYIVEEELCRVGIPVGRGGGGSPAIIAIGTEAQKQQYVRADINDDVYFALGLTEPGAGADLAGLQCRAVRDGDEYVINGQKIYTSAAHYATHIYLMVRTDPSAERHSGISILLVPIDTPGITVRPLWTVQNDPQAPPGTTYGGPRTNEVFFDDVRVPVSCLLGKENEGWNVGQHGLNLDRVGAIRYLMAVHIIEDVLNWMKNDPVMGADLAERETVRDKLAELWVEAQLCRLMTMRSMSIVERNQKFSYEGSAEKVWAAEHGVRSTEAVAQLLGPYGQLLNGSPRAVSRGLFAHNLLGAYQSGINHGSVQILRDQIARKGVGLPRQPR
jgi:alkylation response protein AidB-like acyl-CoA dehydrogenase